MSTEIADFAAIKDEDLLRRMWQQSEDFGRKKEIRAHMYKLREERLRNFYTTAGDMDSNIGLTSGGKSPMTPSHGDSLADQSYQSLKTKEIRDSESPTRLIGDYKYGVGNICSTAPMHHSPPDTSGWNVISSSEITPDGKTQTMNTLATTMGVKELDGGGKKSFAGKNEQMDRQTYEGDDKNYKSSSSHLSNTNLDEHTVIGDERNGRTEMRSSNTTSSSSSKVVMSSSSTIDPHEQHVINEFDNMLNTANRSNKNLGKPSSKLLTEQFINNEQYDRTNQQDISELNQTTSNTIKSTATSNTNTSNIQHSSQQQHHEQQHQQHHHHNTSRISDIERPIEQVISTPGQLISRSIEYPDANTKVITEVKSLPDGTLVTSKKYETTSASSQSFKSSTSSSQQKSSSSTRATTDERVHRNKIEYVSDDHQNKNVKSINIETNESENNKKYIRNNDQIKSGNNVERMEDVRNITIDHQVTKIENNKNILSDVNQKVGEIKYVSDKNEQVKKTIQQTEDNTNIKFVTKEETTKKINQTENINKDRLIQTYVDIDLSAPSEKDRLNKTVKKDLSSSPQSVTNLEKLQPQSQQQPNIPTKKISAPINDAAHEAFVRSLRCVSPSIDNRQFPSNKSLSKSDRGRRSPSRDTNISQTSSKVSSATTVINKTTNRYHDNKKSVSKSPERYPNRKISTNSDQQRNNYSSISTETIDIPLTTKKHSITKSPDRYANKDHNKPNQREFSKTPEKTVRKPSSSSLITPSVDNPNEDEPRYRRPTISSQAAAEKSHPIKPTIIEDTNTIPDQPVNYENRPTNDRRRPQRPTTPKLVKTNEVNDDDESIRSNSPTSTVSDIEYISMITKKHITTDVDDSDENYLTEQKLIDHDQHDGAIYSVTDKPKPNENLNKNEPFYLNETTDKNSPHDNNSSDEKEPKQRHQLTRSETYEERCRLMLGMKSTDENDSNTVKITKNDQISKDTVDFMEAEKNTVTNKVIQRESSVPAAENKVKQPSNERSPDRKNDYDTSTIRRKSKTPIQDSTPSKKTPVKKSTTPESSPQRKPSNTMVKTPKTNYSSPESSPVREPTSSKIKKPSIKNTSNTTTIDESSSQHTSIKEMKTNRRSQSPTEIGTKPQDSAEKKKSTKSPSPSNYQRKPSNTIINHTSPKRKSEPESPIKPDETNTFKDKKPINKKSIPASNIPDPKLTTSPTRKPSTVGQTKTMPKYEDNINEQPNTQFYTKKEITVNATEDFLKTERNIDRPSITSATIKKKDQRPGVVGVKSPQQPDSVRPTNNDLPTKRGLTPVSVKTTVADNNLKVKTKKLTENDESTTTRHVTSAKITLSPESLRRNNNKPKTQSSTKKYNTQSRVVDDVDADNDDNEDADADDDDDDDDDTTTIIEVTKVISKKVATKKLPITERKDSAPVYSSVKRCARDHKMTRSSTSDSVIGTTNTTNKSPQKSTTKFDTKQRPTKCVATKTINLTTTNASHSNLKKNITTEETNIVIDIQQAKSSREPTPNRIVPTPASPEEDTGKPRYPDTVTEPDDDLTTRRNSKPKIKNIPIYEEESKQFVSCCITEVHDDNIIAEQHRNTGDDDDADVDDNLDEEDEPVDHCFMSVSDKVSKFSSVVDENVSTTVHQPSPQKERPNKLNLQKITRTDMDDTIDTTDECLLSVHDKVSKFITTAEEIKKPKASFEIRKGQTPELESPSTSFMVNEKVAQFISTAEEMKKPKPSAPFEPEQTPDRDDVDDISSLSVNHKINKFLTTAAEQLTPTKSSEPLKPIVLTTQYDDLDETLVDDECLLSVSDKVNKFITTAEQISASVPQRSPELVARIERQISKRDDSVEETTNTPLKRPSVDRSVEPNSFINPTTMESTKSPILSKKSVTDRYVPDKEKSPIPTSPPADNIMLRSTDAIKKARSVFENIDAAASSSKQRDILSRPSIWEDRRSKGKDKDVKLQDIGVYTRNTTNDQNSSPKLSDSYTSSKETSPMYERRDRERSANKELFEEHAAIKARLSAERRDKSIEKEMYAKPILKQYSPSHLNDNDHQYNNDNQFKYTDEDNSIRDSGINSNADKPSYMNHTVCSLEHIRRDSIEINKSNIKNHQTHNKIHHYQHQHQQHQHQPQNSRQSQPLDDSATSTQPNGTVKFGVELKRTNSQQHSQTRRKSSSSEIPHIEGIFDLELLEKMLETVVGYEQRRRIRSQIRIVKKQFQTDDDDEVISSEKTTKTTTSKYRVEPEPEPERIHDAGPRRLSSPLRRPLGSIHDNIDKRSPSIEKHPINNQQQSPHLSRKSSSPTRKSSLYTSTNETSEHIIEINQTNKYKTNGIKISDRSPSPKLNIRKTDDTTGGNRTGRHNISEKINNNHRVDRSSSPKVKSNQSQTVSKNNSPNSNDKVTLKKFTKTEDEKPIWATKNILKKASETTTRTFKSTAAVKKTPQKAQPKPKTIENIDDCVTSSYGIGPTDEDGKPLFGIRALKKKSTTSSTTTTKTTASNSTMESSSSLHRKDLSDQSFENKVTGTIMQETLVSKNGGAPVGSRTVTLYSSNPNDLKPYIADDESIMPDTDSSRRITSVTKVKQIGDKDDMNDNVSEIRVVRRGSVKELSEKFIQKESLKQSATSSVEKNAYPKAGLILRTQSSRESTPGASSLYSGSGDFDECDIEVRTSKQRTSRGPGDNEEVCGVGIDDYDDQVEYRTVKHERQQTRSFLNSNGSKVTGVQDVLDRMRNADNVEEYGDTVEDREARALLNKFLGATVLMTGMESMVVPSAKQQTSQQKVVSTSSSSRTTKTSATSSSSPPTTKTTTSTVKTVVNNAGTVGTSDIDDIWNIDLLKELLEKSSNYETRRHIRARIRQIMADKEASARTKETGTVTTADSKLKSEKNKPKEIESENSDDEYEEVEVTDNEDGDDDDNDDNVVNDKNGDKAKDNDKIKVSNDKDIVDGKKESKIVKENKDNSVTTAAVVETIKKDQSTASATALQGESLLLPLLQGLLYNKKSSSQNKNINNNNNNNNINNKNNNQQRSNVNGSNIKNNQNVLSSNINKQKVPHHIEDSGTESGEDLKLLAAGLHDHIEMQRGEQQQQQQLQNTMVQDDLLTDVTTALERLQSSLRNGSDIDNLDTTKRNALLALVSRLQIGLLSPEKITAPTPAPYGQTGTTLTNIHHQKSLDTDENDYQDGDDGGGGGGGDDSSGGNELSSRKPITTGGGSGHSRFAKRRNRQNRHTVGVSDEELADARRYIEELVLMENLSNGGTPKSSETTPKTNNPITQFPYLLQKQSSAGAVLTMAPNATTSQPVPLFRPNQFLPKQLPAQSVADIKSFAKTTLPNSTENVHNIVQSLTATPAEAPTAEPPTVQLRDRKPKYKFMRQSLSYDQSGDKQNNIEINRRPFSESITVDFNRKDDNSKSIKTVQSVVQRFNKVDDLVNESIPDRRIIENNFYNKVQHSPKISANNIRNCRSRTPPPQATLRPFDDNTNSEFEKTSPSSSNKYSSKKLKMKRANTIDIPKPQNMQYHQNDDDYDDDEYDDYDDDDDDDDNQGNNQNSIGLKRAFVTGHVKHRPKKVIPTFQPKTENDHKFLAFLQKQNPTNSLGWVNPNKSPQPSGNKHNWSNAFGHLKNNFENTEQKNMNNHFLTKKPPPSAARNFWKNTTELPSAPTTPPVINKPRTMNTLFNSSKFSSSLNNVNPVAISNSAPESPIINHSNGGYHAPMYGGSQPVLNKMPLSPEPRGKIIVPKPILHNEFSHAPASAFKPIAARKLEIPAFKPIAPAAIVDPSLKPQQYTNGYHGSSDNNNNNNNHTNNSIINKSSPCTSRTLANAYQYSTQSPQSIKSPTIGIPWANKQPADNNKRVLSIAASKFDVKSPPEIIPPAKNHSPRSNSMRAYGTAKDHMLPSYIAKSPRIQQKRGSLPNDSTYNYFSEPEILNYDETHLNTRQNENIYYDYHRPAELQRLEHQQQQQQQQLLIQQQHQHQHQQQQKPYYAPSLPNLSANSYLDSRLNNGYSIPPSHQHQQQYIPSQNYAISQQHHRPLQYPLPPPPPPQSTSPYYQQKSNYEPNTNYNHQLQYQNAPPLPPHSPSSAITSQYPQLSTNQSNANATMYPYTCTDYTQPAVSTYIPHVTVTKSQPIDIQSDSITNPLAAPVILSSANPVISPRSSAAIINTKPDLLKIFDYPSSSEHSPLSTSVSPMTINNDNIEDDEIIMMDGVNGNNDDDDNDYDGINNDMQEYTAKTQVMRGPVSQTAVTVQSKTSRIGDEKMTGKNSQEAKSLQSILRNIKPKSSGSGAISRNNNDNNIILSEGTPTDIINKYKEDVKNIARKTYSSSTNEQKKLVQNILNNQPSHVKQSTTIIQTKPIASVIPTTAAMPKTFKTPTIIETPSSPMALIGKPEMSSHVIFNNISSHPPPLPQSAPHPHQLYNGGVSGGSGISNGQSYHNQYNNEAIYRPPPPAAMNIRSPNSLSKSDSWTKICQLNNKPPPPAATTHSVQKTKQTLALPKQFEAGLRKTEISEKQRTVAAYFSGEKSPQSLSRSSSQQNIITNINMSSLPSSTLSAAANAAAAHHQYQNYSSQTKSMTSASAASSSLSSSSSSSQQQNRNKKSSQITRIKTSEKASIGKQLPSSGLARSHTMPHMVNMNYLDENLKITGDSKSTGESTGTTVTTTTTTTQKVISKNVAATKAATTTTATKSVSPFAKFRQLDKQSSTTSSPSSPNSPSTPQTPGGGSAPLFKFTDPALSARAATVKDILLQWCQSKTKEYENIQITNFSTAWSDGLAFCALIHHFLPDAFDYSALTPKQRRHNFTLAFRVADEKAGIAPLLDVEDMVIMKKPDWKCVFTYVQSIHRRFRNVE